MRTIKKYGDFLLEYNFRSIDTDKQTALFLEGSITEEEWNTGNSLDESLASEAEKWVVDKVLSKLKAVYEATIKKTTKNLFSKIRVVMDAVWKAILFIKKELHPVLWKACIVLFIIVMILLFTALTAKGAEGGETAKNLAIMWDYAIGFFDTLNSDKTSIDTNMLLHAQAYCMDMKDGILGNEGIDWAQERKDEIEKMVDLAKQNFEELSKKAMDGDKATGAYIMKMIEKGREFVGFVHQHVGNVKIIQLIGK